MRPRISASTPPADWPVLLTAREVALLLCIHEDSVYERIRDGRLPVWRSGRSVRVPREALMGAAHG